MLTPTIENIIREIVRGEIRTALEDFRTEANLSEWVRIRDCGLPNATRVRLAREGKLKQAKVGRDLHVRRTDVASYFESQARHEKQIRDASSDYERLVAIARERSARRR